MLINVGYTFDTNEMLIDVSYIADILLIDLKVVWYLVYCWYTINNLESLLIGDILLIIIEILWKLLDTYWYYVGKMLIQLKVDWYVICC